MRILTTSDLDSVNGGLGPLIPITWAVVVDTGFAGAVGGAWATGWGIGTFVSSNIDSYGESGGGWAWGGPSTTESCPAPQSGDDDTPNSDGMGSSW